MFAQRSRDFSNCYSPINDFIIGDIIPTVKVCHFSKTALMEQLKIYDVSWSILPPDIFSSEVGKVINCFISAS